jgi:hypothetical protein
MADRRKQWRAERLAAGLCAFCGKPREGRAFMCAACLAHHAELQRKRYKPKYRRIGLALQAILDRCEDENYEPTEAELEAIIAHQMEGLPSWYKRDAELQAGHPRTEDEVGAAMWRMIRRGT